MSADIVKDDVVAGPRPGQVVCGGANGRGHSLGALDPTGFVCDHLGEGLDVGHHIGHTRQGFPRTRLECVDERMRFGQG